MREIAVPVTPSRHSLRGECGLKFQKNGHGCNRSHVTLCEESVDWNIVTPVIFDTNWSVTLCEESVDWNSFILTLPIIFPRHSLRGECGLKYGISNVFRKVYWSLSARRVWIEISAPWPLLFHQSVTLCEESVDWNCFTSPHMVFFSGHSLRGECGLKYPPGGDAPGERVTLCEESVDWNMDCRDLEDTLCVTLCEESVDWNGVLAFLARWNWVTLCEESVDWNRTWILGTQDAGRHSLRGECGLKSCHHRLNANSQLVTLCEESVDWNPDIKPDDIEPKCHSLRGECGLKLQKEDQGDIWVGHSLRGECGLKS